MNGSPVRRFHLGDILSVTTGRLLSLRRMDGLYDILNWMTGDNLFTHQLPRACRECAPRLLEQHPALAEVAEIPAFDGSAAAVAAWLRQWVDRFGEYLPVQPLDPADHTHMDALSEMRLVAPDAHVIAVTFPGARDE